MANQAYYPTREGDQLTWFTNLQSKIATYYTPLDISPARQAKLTLSLNWLIWTWGTFLPSRRQDAPAATAWRNQLATGTSNGGTAVAPPEPATLTPPAGDPFFERSPDSSRRSAVGNPPRVTTKTSAKASPSSAPPKPLPTSPPSSPSSPPT